MAQVSDNFLLDTVPRSVMLGIQGDSKRIHTFYVTQAFTATVGSLRHHATIEEPNINLFSPHTGCSQIMKSLMFSSIHKRSKLLYLLTVVWVNVRLISYSLTYYK
jgi:hypothetical protein